MKPSMIRRVAWAALGPVSIVLVGIFAQRAWSQINCNNQVTAWYNYPSCYCSGSTNGAPCECNQYSSSPSPPGTNDVWQTYGDHCKSKSYNLTNCVAKGYARLYNRDANGSCKDGSCSGLTYGQWVYYGLQQYYATVKC